jgi:hypothetical protein
MQDVINNPWEIALLLGAKAWGKTLVKNQLKSENWWRNRLKTLLVEMPDVELLKNNPGIYNVDGTFAATPVPFEQEMGWTEDTSQYWLGWLRIVFKKHNERKTKT